MTGGNVGSIQALRDSMIEITGGLLGYGSPLVTSLSAHPGSTVKISGGTLGRYIQTDVGSNVEVVGGEFRLNGAEYTGDSLELVGSGLSPGRWLTARPLFSVGRPVTTCGASL